MSRLPVHIISGALGAGKTTMIQHLLAQKPAHERWAVLVNEFGLVGLDAALLAQPAPGVYPSEADEEVSACGWIYAPEEIFCEERLLKWLRAPGLPEQALRIKGVFRVEDGWIALNATAEQHTLSASNYTRDSRVEIIAPSTPAPDWAHMSELLHLCILIV